MEFFIPGLLLFLLAVAVSFVIAPRFTPLIASVLSIVFLTYGVYDHYKMFASEYRLSTWQQPLKIYAPAIMIGAIILFIIYGILALFTKGAVPVPPIPNITVPNADTLTSQVVNSLNTLGDLVTNKTTDMLGEVNKNINKVNANRTNILGLNSEKKLNEMIGTTETNQTNKANKTNKANNNLSRSFLETI